MNFHPQYQSPSDILLGGGKAPKGGKGDTDGQGDGEEGAVIIAGEAVVILAAVCQCGRDQKDVEVQIA